MAFTENLAAFFSDFATPATLNGQAVTGIFHDASALARVGQVGAASLQSCFVLPTASVPSGVVEMPFVFNATTYVVAEHEQDGTGVSTLYLELA